MSNEQLLIYIYGIYPQGGFTLFLVTVSLAYLGVTAIIDAHAVPENGPYWMKKGKALYITTAIVGTLGYFIPDKNTFLAIVATPTLLESLNEEDGKLNKINKLLDMAIDKATTELENTNEQSTDSTSES